MRAGTLQTWSNRRSAVRQRLARRCPSALLLLLVGTTQHALEEAARFAGLQTSLVAKRLPSPAKGATTTLERLSTPQARQCAQALARRHGLPWKILLSIDRPRQPRASLHPANAPTFHPGKGDGLGHPWTTLVLLRGDRLMPLQPLPCQSKRSCQTPGLASQSDQERVVASLRTLDLEDSMGADDPRAGVVVAESGSDNHKSEKAIAATGWHGIIALSTPRRVKAEARSLRTSPSPQWCPIATFFRRHRRLTWTPRRLAPPGNTRQRMDVRVRPTSGSLRYGGKVALGCSARRNRPEDRRTYLAGNDLRATARQSVRGYRRRWAVELVQKRVKQPLGFAEGAPHGFDAVISPVPWVYGASILLHMSPPGLSPGVQSIGDKQRALRPSLADPEKRHILPPLSPIGGVQHSKDALRQALAGP